jgi:hypothetical protein
LTTTGLSADPTEYRRRLGEQSDEQIDAWVAELMRDIAIRRGVLRAIEDFRGAARLSELEFERVFEGRLMVPAITLWALVPGIRALVPDARDRLVEYLVRNFDEIVYV